MNSRKELAVAVLGCAVAAGLALYAASRQWRVDVTVRPAPLPPLREDRSGGSLVPALPALSLVALAGAGALLATRGLGRLAVGVLMLLSGLGIAGTAAFALAELDGVGAGWPLLDLVAGLGVAAVGAGTVARGRGWPGLGTRYERAPEADPRMWEALDRGEDPTAP